MGFNLIGAGPPPDPNTPQMDAEGRVVYSPEVARMIREAANDALERAAMICDRCDLCCVHASEDIRALKQLTADAKLSP